MRSPRSPAPTSTSARSTPRGSTHILSLVSQGTDNPDTDLQNPANLDTDLTAGDVAWDLDTLVEGTSVDELLDRSDQLADQIAAYRGRVASLSAAELAELLTIAAELQEVEGRSGYYAMLRFSENTGDPERGALMMKVQERGTSVATKLVFLELEWAGAR